MFDGACVREGLCAPAFLGAPERSTSKNHFFLFGGARPGKKYNLLASVVYRDGHYDFDFGSASSQTPACAATKESSSSKLLTSSARASDCGLRIKSRFFCYSAIRTRPAAQLFNSRRV